MEKVIRGLCQDVLKYTTTRIVDDYLHKRLEPNRLAEADPLKRVSNDMMDRIIKEHTRSILRQSINSLA